MSDRETLCADQRFTYRVCVRCGLRPEDHDRGDAVGRAAPSERMYGCVTFLPLTLSVAKDDAYYVLAWLRQSEAPSNIIALQQRVMHQLHNGQESS